MDIIGKLAVVKDREPVYVVWNYYDTSKLYMLIELDRPQDGEDLILEAEEFRLLEPLEIIERVAEWK